MRKPFLSLILVVVAAMPTLNAQQASPSQTTATQQTSKPKAQGNQASPQARGQPTQATTANKYPGRDKGSANNPGRGKPSDNNPGTGKTTNNNIGGRKTTNTVMTLRPVKHIPQFAFGSFQNEFLLLRKGFACAIYIEVEHRHRGLIRRAIAPLAGVCRAFERERDPARIS